VAALAACAAEDLPRGGAPSPTPAATPAAERSGEPRIDGPRIEEPQSGELGLGEVAVYRLDLEAGEFFHLTIDQDGIDVVVALLDPAGRELLTADSPTGNEGPEDLYAVAETTGTYRVEIRPWSPGAPPGRYRLRLAARRPATPEDRTRAAAAAAFSAAERLASGGGAEARDAAAALYERALTLWRSLGDSTQQAITSARLGRLRFDQGRISEALERYGEALRLAAAVDRPGLEISLLNDRSSAWRLRGRPEQARADATRALELARAAGNRREATVALNNLALLHRLEGDPWQALGLYEQALAGWRALGGRGDEAVTLHNLAATYLFVHQLSEARATFEQALDLRRQVGDRGGEAVTLTALAKVQSLTGELEAARESLLAALALRRTVGDRRGEAVTLDQLATVRGKLGEEAAAGDDYRRALAIFRQAGDRLSEAYTRSNLGELEERQGHPGAALEHFDAALALFRHMGETDGEAYVLSRRAGVRRRLGDLGSAHTDAEEALALVESLRHAARSPALQASYFASVREYYELLVQILMQLAAREPGAGWETRAFETAERSRARNLLESVGRGGRSSGGSGREEALERSLRERERDLRAARAAGAPEEEVASLDAGLRTLLLERERVHTAARDAASPSAGSPASRPLSVEEIRRRVLDDDTLLLAYFLGEEASWLFVLDRDSLTSHRLPPRGEIEPAARKLHELLARSHRRGAEVQTRLLAAEMGERLLGPAAERLAGRRLAVVPDGALHLIPFSALRLPAPGQAPGNASPLVVQHEIVHLPSASVLAELRRARSDPPAAAKTLAVVADPVFSASDPRLAAGGIPAAPASPTPRSALPADLTRSARDAGLTGFSRLPFSHREAETLLALVPPAERFQAFGLAARRELVLGDELRGYRMLHFATHGLLHASHPELSGLVLSLVDAAGRRRDGFLRAYEIAELDLPAELVVLSACRTALGQTPDTGPPIDGEGLVGLPRSFLEAGAARVVTSLWDVSDPGTAELMGRFYRGMLHEGLRPAAALRQAQVSMQREERWQAPYYWAAFVLLGEW
jgi:CHAT domain-containing protein/tetratricopeptide (TPR) repeat protein